MAQMSVCCKPSTADAAGPAHMASLWDWAHSWQRLCSSKTGPGGKGTADRVATNSSKIQLNTF